MIRICYCLAITILTCGFVFGQTQYKVVWSFAGAPKDGATPTGNLVADSAGNLYGTTSGGGSAPACAPIGGCGTVFQLSKNPDNTWTETVLYSFCSNFSGSGCLDGAYPKAGLLVDSSGNLYGTTSIGGSSTVCGFGGCGGGTVFKLSPPTLPGGTWTETVLYDFCTNTDKCLDGAVPLSTLTSDASGNLYGTASVGGNGHASGGLVFELSPGQGGWTEKVLYSFCSLGSGEACPDGKQPMAGVTFDKKGNLYGTTYLGGSQDFSGGGTLYKLTPGPSGWTESVLLAGRGPSGAGPLGMVTFDPFGNIFSTFSAGGPAGVGGVFRYVPGVGRNLFWFDGKDGYAPAAGVLIDSKRAALYGTTSGGGFTFGTVFQISARKQETVLYNFCSQQNCVDGFDPVAGLIMDKSGNLYGTTKMGGANNLGVVFQITPAADENPKGRPGSIRSLLADKASK